MLYIAPDFDGVNVHDGRAVCDTIRDALARVPRFPESDRVLKVVVALPIYLVQHIRHLRHEYLDPNKNLHDLMLELFAHWGLLRFTAHTPELWAELEHSELLLQLLREHPDAQVAGMYHRPLRLENPA
jgi:hypothetical protein